MVEHKINQGPVFLKGPGSGFSQGSGPVRVRFFQYAHVRDSFVPKKPGIERQVKSSLPGISLLDFFLRLRNLKVSRVFSLT